MRKSILFLLLFYGFTVFGQGDISLKNSYPTDYFSNPLEIPLILSGTFAELRTDHFHAGLDIKTQQKEGLKVKAAANGYVSRIKISHWGYGKALYITHPNGYTTVYAHLKKFNKQIEAYIKKKQYKKESFEIQVFPSSEALPVSKNEIIAYSGSTGGFVDPHLHFEIRDTKTEKPVNPLFFGIDIGDSKKPRINTLVGYPLNEEAYINRVSIPNQLNLRKLDNSNLLANKIKAFGKIGFGINAYDQLDGAYNKNGLYSLEMFVNGNKVHEFKATSFSFSEGKYINLLIDYERFENLSQRIQKCFVEPSNKLSLYNRSESNGYLDVKDGESYQVEIVAKDFKGNKQKITIPVIGKKDSILVRKKVKHTPYKIDKNRFHSFQKENVTVSFPKNTFYSDLYLDYKIIDSIVQVHTPTVPLNKKYTLTFDISKHSKEEKKHLYIASLNDNGKTNYIPTTKKDSACFSTVKKLGKFTLCTDNQEPTIEFHNFKDGQWVTNFRTLQVKIKDDGSGIKSYRGEIDGAWILMEYNVKKNLLTYDLSDKKFITAKHQFKLVVTDQTNNTKTIEANFFRKK